MSVWGRQVGPRVVEVVLADPIAGRWRARVCGGVSGEVLEIGFGAGQNLAYYGSAVTRVHAVDPSDVAWGRAQRRISQFGRPVQRVARDAASLPLPDAGVDAVVSTWTLCTVPDLRGALAEVRRVLRPGGRLHLVEHSLAPGEGVRRVQRGIQPIWGPVAGGCHLDRDIPAALADSGFAVDSLDARYAAPWPAHPWAWFVSGSA